MPTALVPSENLADATQSQCEITTSSSSSRSSSSTGLAGGGAGTSIDMQTQTQLNVWRHEVLDVLMVFGAGVHWDLRRLDPYMDFPRAQENRNPEVLSDCDLNFDRSFHSPMHKPSHVFISSQGRDYCNSSCARLHQKSINCLQLVQNASARVLTRPTSSTFPPSWPPLHS